MTARCGINFAHAWQNGGARGYASPTAREALRELAAMGVVDVAITGFGWMPSLTSTEVKWQQPPPGGETEAAIRAAAAAVRAKGQRLMLKPHLWVHTGAWQAELKPDPAAGGWPAWFASYEQFIFAQAELAAELKADWFVIGNELGSATAAAPERWAALIAGVRTRYTGRITYAANWDEAERVTFWPLLDAIGINFYAPLSTKPSPSEAELRAGSPVCVVGETVRRNLFDDGDPIGARIRVATISCEIIGVRDNGAKSAYTIAGDNRTAAACPSPPRSAPLRCATCAAPAAHFWTRDPMRVPNSKQLASGLFRENDGGCCAGDDLADCIIHPRSACNGRADAGTQTTTMKMLVCRYAGVRRNFRMDLVSNSDITQSEFERWSPRLA